MRPIQYKLTHFIWGHVTIIAIDNTRTRMKDGASHRASFPYSIFRCQAETVHTYLRQPVALPKLQTASSIAVNDRQRTRGTTSDAKSYRRKVARVEMRMLHEHLEDCGYRKDDSTLFLFDST